MEMEKRKKMKTEKQKEMEQKRLLEELNKRQFHIIGLKSNL